MEFEYTLVRSAKRRKLTITVERDRSVVVHAPVDTPAEKIQQVIATKRQWIYEKTHHPQKYKSLPHPPGKELVNGESMLYLGRNYRIEIVPNATGEITFAQKFLVPAQLVGTKREAFRRWYIARAKVKILPRVRSQTRQLGVDYAAAKIADNRYRWGSCTVKNNLNFNWRLIKAPMFVIDYVVVHELAHLIEANHTPQFWNIVKARTTSSDKARTWLKEYGNLLEQEI